MKSKHLSYCLPFIIGFLVQCQVFGQCTKIVTVEFVSHNFISSCNFNDSNGLDPHIRMYDQGTLIWFNEVENFSDVNGPEDNVLLSRANGINLCDDNGYTIVFQLNEDVTTRTYTFELFEKNSPGEIGMCGPFTPLLGFGDNEFESGDYTFNCATTEGTIDPDPSVCHSINYTLSFEQIGDVTIDTYVGTFCPDFSKEINGIVYDINNPQGTEIVQTPGVCDTTFVIDMQFVDEINPIIIGPENLCASQLAMLELQDDYLLYSWSDGTTAESIEIIGPGSYQVTVTDSNLCMYMAEIIIGSEALESPELLGDFFFCTGGETTISVVGEFENYEWSNGDTGSEITVSSAIVYTVTVTDGNGCSATADASVQEFNLTVDIEGGDKICPGGSLVLSVGEDYTVEEWSNQSVDPTITIMEDGQYSVTVTDNNGCTIVGEITIVEEALEPVQITGDNQLCEGLELLLAVPDGFQEVAWSTGESTDIITVSDPGNYSVTVTDTNNCSSSNEITISEFVLDGPDILGDSLICENTIGELFIADIYESIEWNTGATTNIIEIDRTDTYVVTVTDENGCTAEASLRAEEITPISPDILGDEMFCPGTQANLFVEDIYESVIWSTGQTTNSISVDQADLYSVTVTLFEGCVSSNEILITEDDRITKDTILFTCNPMEVNQEIISFVTAEGCEVDSIINIMLFEDETCDVVLALETEATSCSEGDEGMVQFALISGFPPVTFELIDDAGNNLNQGILSNLNEEITIEGLASGLYQLMMTDVFDMSHIANFSIAQADPIQIFYTIEQDILPGQEAILEVDFDESEVIQYHWSLDGNIVCNECLEFAVNPDDDISYDLFIEDIFGCTYEFMSNINVIRETEFFVPNILDLSDERNSIWELAGEGLLEVLDFEVYSRWGQLVYDAPQGTTSWNGTDGDTPLEQGVYVIRLNLLFEDGPQISHGTVLILR